MTRLGNRAEGAVLMVAVDSSCCVPGEPGCLLVRSPECTEIESGVKRVTADFYVQSASKSSSVIGNMKGSRRQRFRPRGGLEDAGDEDVGRTNSVGG